jgi:inorganic pyrophosphatase
MECIFESLKPRDPASRLTNVVIDTPRGSRNKFKYDEKLHCFRLSRILPAGYSFPYDFGSIPGTRADDGDAVDVLVLLDSPSFCGCLVTVRLMGIIAAHQTEKRKTIRNDRLLAVPQTPVNRPAIRHIADLESDRLAEIEHFFGGYNLAQGRSFKPYGRFGPKKAEAFLDAAIARYSESKGL